MLPEDILYITINQSIYSETQPPTSVGKKYVAEFAPKEGEALNQALQSNLQLQSNFRAEGGRDIYEYAEGGGDRSCTVRNVKSFVKHREGLGFRV